MDRLLGELVDMGVVEGGAVLTLVEAGRYAFGGPLGLGPPAKALLAPLTAEDLRVLARNLDARPPSRKAEVLAVVAGVLRDADRVRSLVAGASAEVRTLLGDVARTGRPVEQPVVDRDAAAAGGSLLRVATGLLDTAGCDPVAGLRGGGVGVRELRRLAKALGCSAGELRLALSVVHAAGLLVLTEDGAAPSDRYDGWLAGDPPEQLAALFFDGGGRSWT